VPLLRFNRVSKSYASVPALVEVSFDVERGEFVALVGRSGCGKSTLLNVAGAMDFPTSGEVVLDGVVTSSLGEAALTLLRREKVGFVFQSFQLLASLSVVENVELPLLLARRPRARESALDRLRQVEMEDYAARLPYQLSGGQMQRVAIARALVHSPALLLADEPTGNLDSHTGTEIMNMIRDFNQQLGMTIVMVTHERALAERYAQRLIFLADGKLVGDESNSAGATEKDYPRAETDRP
jgi:ABC-type lipoprotein export system ATPase subunit